MKKDLTENPNGNGPERSKKNAKTIDGPKTLNPPNNGGKGHSDWPIICLGTTAILVVVLLMLSAFTGVLVYMAVKKYQEPGEIHIDSLGSSSVEPLSMLEIKGSGFDPDHYAISVIFIIRDIPFTISATYADSDKVEVVVPPYLGPDTTMQCDVKVLQVSDDRVMTSNVLEGLEIEPMQELNSSIETGRYTGLYMDICMDSLFEMVLNSTDTDLTAALMEQIQWLQGVRHELDRSIADDLNYFGVGGNDVNITRLDEFIFNMVTRTVEVLPENAISTEQTRSEDYEALTREAQLGQVYDLKLHNILSTALPELAKFSIGMITTVACLAGGAGLGLSLIAGVALGVGTSWLMQLACGENPKPLTTLQTIVEAAIDFKLFFAAGAMGQLLPLYKTFNEALDTVERYNKGEPEGGVLLNDMNKFKPLGDMPILFKKAPGEIARRLTIPEEPSSVPFKEAIPKVPAGRVVYSGNFDGWKTFIRLTNCPQCGSIVNEIDYYVVGSIDLTAMVDEKGKMSGTLVVSGHWGVRHCGMPSLRGPVQQWPHKQQSINFRIDLRFLSGCGIRGDGPRDIRYNGPLLGLW